MASKVHNLMLNPTLSHITSIKSTSSTTLRFPMASKVHNLMPNPTLSHISSIKSTTISSFGQVSLPKKSIRSSLSVVSSVASEAVSVNDLGSLWKEIQGSGNWDDLVDPLHPLLQQEIIRYGEFVSACYKAFDLDSNSKRYLHCKYGKKSLFEEVGMGDCGYQVTKYIYATPDANSIPIPNGDHSCGRWIGYVAVASDDAVSRLGRRDILVSFRGTVTNHEWMANLMSSLTPARLDPHNSRPEVKVESGFLSLYTSDEDDKFGLGSCREQLLSEVSRLLEKHKGEENVSITLAGHSMGSSLALLLAYDLAELGLCSKPRPFSRQPTTHHVYCFKKEIPITVFSFGGPRVGNAAFKERCEELGVKMLRIVNVNDPITKMPGVFFNENFRVLGGKYELPWSCSCYSHVGVEIALDFFNVQKPSCVHDLETYISLIKNRGKGMMHEDTNYFQVDNSVLDWARKLFLSSALNINMIFPWVDVATNMVSMIQ